MSEFERDTLICGASALGYTESAAGAAMCGQSVNSSRDRAPTITATVEVPASYGCVRPSCACHFGIGPATQEEQQ